MSLRLLLSAAGTGTAFGYAQAKARGFPDIELWTGDIHPAGHVTASLYAQQHVQLPPSADADYFPFLERLLREQRIDVYLPLIDSEVAGATEHRDSLAARIASNSMAFCQAAIAKSRYGDWLPHVDGAHALLPLAPEELEDGPLVAKRDGGFGGRATRMVDTAAQAHALLAEGWFLYRFVEGEEYTVDCFPLDGDVLVSVRQRLETRAGVCVKARIVREQPLHELARAMGRHFALTEPFCFQTRRNGGSHYVIDINPRLGAGTAMSALNGMDFFAAHLARICGQDPARFLVPRFAECVVTRQYGDYLMSASP